MVWLCVAGRPFQNEEWQGLSCITFERLMAYECGPQYVPSMHYDDVQILDILSIEEDRVIARMGEEAIVVEEPKNK